MGKELPSNMVLHFSETVFTQFSRSAFANSTSPSLWQYVCFGSYTRIDDFIQGLLPFWRAPFHYFKPYSDLRPKEGSFECLLTQKVLFLQSIFCHLNS